MQHWLLTDIPHDGEEVSEAISGNEIAPYMPPVCPTLQSNKRLKCKIAERWNHLQTNASSTSASNAAKRGQELSE